MCRIVASIVLGDMKYQWRKQMDWDHPNSPPPPICFVSSTVQPIIPLERMDRLGSYQGVLLSTPCPYCPSYYNYIT